MKTRIWIIMLALAVLLTGALAQAETATATEAEASYDAVEAATEAAAAAEAAAEAAAAEAEAMAQQAAEVSYDAVEQAAEAEAEAEAETPTAQELRYYFEHRFLPEYFYDSADEVVEGTLTVGVYPLWAYMAEDFGLDPTYPEADYVQTGFTLEDGTRVARLEMPEPDANLLCYRIYLFYDPQTGDAAYITIESDSMIGEPLVFVCMWGADGTHYNFGAQDLVTRDDPAYEDTLAQELTIATDVWQQVRGQGSEDVETED